MFTAKNYVKVKSLEEAFELNKVRNNAVMGGLMWLKQSKKNINTLIDLSGLNLDKITENESNIEIGAMASLRQLEKSEIIAGSFGDYFKEALKGIVGVQFRNGATVGGSVFGRYGFSDVITSLLALDASVVIYKGQEIQIPLADYVSQKKDNSILVRLILKKTSCISAYESMRIVATDFPVLTVSASLKSEGPNDSKTLSLAVGARPNVASLLIIENFNTSELYTSYTQDVNNNSLSNLNALVEKYLIEDLNNLVYGNNLKAGSEYRRILAKALATKALFQIAEKGADSWK
ncbi:MAG: FAD binding domain-containing protein [Proteocatella sp.]